MKPSHEALGPWIRRFLLEHLVGERNLATNTQKSYRDTLRLLLPQTAKRSSTSIDRLTIPDLSAELVRDFLVTLETQHRCSISTRSQRLSAIHALARFIGERSPEHMVWCGEIRAVPFKRTGKNVVPYFEKSEMDGLLAAPDQRTQQGRRDHAVLLFLYNSGARASEAAAFRVADFEGDEKRGGMARLRGKGAKIRHVPLWRQTVAALLPLIRSRAADDHVFRNRHGSPLTRFGIYALVERHAASAQKALPSLARKRASPHTIRHYVGSRTIPGEASLGAIGGSLTNIFPA